ncbi:MAG: GNAT family N-acetyltransferase [Desulfosporosinus sp.]|nr:GNAT family N-acetyltransferase [Desulfosporosinus sp.]
MIRLANKHDAAQITDIYRPYIENTSISFETIVPSKEEMETRIERILTNNPWLVFEENNIILGYAYASKHRERAAYKWAVDVSVYVRQDHRCKGIGKRLYTALLSVLRLQGYCNVYAGICLPNESSVGIHENFGFNKIAHYNKVGYKFGQWHDVGWWEFFLEQHNSEPSDPLPISNIEQYKIFSVLSQS